MQGIFDAVGLSTDGGPRQTCPSSQGVANVSFVLGHSKPFGQRRHSLRPISSLKNAKLQSSDLPSVQKEPIAHSSPADVPLCVKSVGNGVSRIAPEVQKNPSAQVSVTASCPIP